jgi:hypothetical protein
MPPNDANQRTEISQLSGIASRYLDNRQKFELHFDA